MPTAIAALRPHLSVVPKGKPEPKPDSVFFIKSQLKVGTHLLCLGRLERPTVWTVTRIVSHRPNGLPLSTGEVQYLSDRIYFRRSNGTRGNAERSGTFGYLSYSAIWRIA